VLAGLGLLLAALGLILAALAQAGMALFLAGTIVAGVAVGAVFLGSLATANRLAPPGRRGQAISTYFVSCYCGLIIPVVGVGVAAGFIGVFRAVLALSILLAGPGGSGPVTGQQPGRPSPARYEIRVRGHLGATMLRAFPALHPETRGGDTLLRVPSPTRPPCTAYWPGSRRSDSI
jgi:MFS family permease